MSPLPTPTPNNPTQFPTPNRPKLPNPITANPIIPDGCRDPAFCTVIKYSPQTSPYIRYIYNLYNITIYKIYPPTPRFFLFFFPLYKIYIYKIYPPPPLPPPPPPQSSHIVSCRHAIIAALTPPVIGSVTSHATTMFRNIIQSTFSRERNLPTITMLPTLQCVVLMGMPRLLATSTVKAEPISIQNPLVGVQDRTPI